MYFSPWIICSKKPIYLSLLTSPHRKEMGETVFWSFFSQGLEEMHHELSKDGENHKLGDVRTSPLDLHTLGLHTSNFCFSINALYRINLERLLFVFVLVWFLFWDPHYHFLYEKDTGNMGWNILHAFIVLGKGMSKLIFNDTYSCMIHELLYE